MTRRYRIMHCLRAPVGGLFRHVCDLASAEAARGHDVGIVCAASGDPLTNARLAALTPLLTLGVHRLDMGREIGLSDLHATRAVRGIVHSFRADVVHGHGAKGGAYARLAGGRRTGWPVVVYTPHGGSLHYGARTLKGRVYMQAELRLLPRTDAIVFESDYSRGRFEAQVATPRTLTRVVPNGLLDAEFVPVATDTDAADFLFVGELRQLKGVDLLLTALAELRRTRPVRAVVVGGGPDAGLFRSQAETLGLASAVRFAGVLPARQAFALGHILVMPSRAESLPYIVLEAAAAGRPLLATCVGGIPEITAGTATTLIPPDDATALTAAMAAALDRPQALAERADELRTAVRARFTVDAMTDAILDTYAAAYDRRYRQLLPNR